MIRYKANLAIECTPVESLPDKGELHQISENNHECLKQALLLDELSCAHLDEHAFDSKDASRLDKKLDLLLGLLGSLIAKQKQATSTAQVTVGSNDIEWQRHDTTAIRHSDLIMVQLYIHPLSVDPLQLYCRVSEANTETITASIVSLEATEQELLEKYIFLNHRRTIAAERKPHPSQG